MDIIWIDECRSTNSHIASLPLAGEGTVVSSRCQTAGRGQKGNTWESEPGKNLTFSAMWKPEGIAARDQFAISEATALSVTDLLGELGIDAKVKWPNDIYVGDKKICGILIEHSVTGTELSRTIAGVGINVNQREFVSDAPNPVSVIQIIGAELSLEPLLERYVSIFGGRLAGISSEEGRTRIHSEFRENMWRFDGRPYPFRDRDSGKTYPGIIRGVEQSGFLRVENTISGEVRKYAFKEVEFLLSDGF